MKGGGITLAQGWAPREQQSLLSEGGVGEQAPLQGTGQACPLGSRPGENRPLWPLSPGQPECPGVCKSTAQTDLCSGPPPPASPHASRGLCPVAVEFPASSPSLCVCAGITAGRGAEGGGLPPRPPSPIQQLWIQTEVV